VRKSYQNAEIDSSQPAVPDTVSVALAELAGEMRERLLALAVGTGLQVMAAIMDEDVRNQFVVRNDSTGVCTSNTSHCPRQLTGLSSCR